MKKVLLLITVIITGLLLASCSMDEDLPGKVCFVSLALDYDGYIVGDSSYTISYEIPGSQLDQAGLVSAITNLSTNSEDSVTTFYNFNNSGNNYGNSWDAINTAINNLDLKEEDVLIFHYSGHGDTDGSIYGIKNSDTNYSTININTVLSTFTSLDCNVVLLMDSCFSGNFITTNETLSDGYSYEELKLRTNYKLVEGQEELLTAIENAIKDFGEKHTTSKLWVIAASAYNLEAPNGFYTNDGTYHSDGILSYCATNYLKGTRSEYTVQGMYKELKETMADLESSNHPTTFMSCPDTNLRVNDLVLFRRSK